MADLSPKAGKVGSLRLLWLIDSLTIGGAERLVIPFARIARARGLRLRVCCLKTINGNPLEKETRALGVSFTNLEARHLRDFSAFRRLVRLIAADEIDLIHAHLTYAAIWGVLAARLTRKPCVATLHTPPVAGPLWNRDVLRHRLMCRLLDRWSDGVTAVSSALAHAYAGQINPSKLAVVRNGIDFETFASATSSREAIRREFDLPSAARIAITVSVLREERKGLHVLLRAVPAIIRVVPEARFLIVGDGPLRPSLAEEAARAGIGGFVRWAGERRDIPALLAASDLFILPSLHDPYPTALLEAMAAGLPVVASRADGVPEILESAVTGLLVPPGDHQELARSVIELLRQPAMLAAMGRAGADRARREFSAAAWVDRLEAEYARVITLRREAEGLQAMS